MNVFDTADLLVAHTLAHYGDDVSIIAYYGSHAKGRASDTSDLDLFYIPARDGAADKLCAQFVLDGLPYDFWPVSWPMAEAIANARSERPWAVSASLIADAKLLHARSDADRSRFEALQARIAELMLPAARGEMIERALDAFNAVLAALGEMQLQQTGRDLAPIDTLAGQRLIESAANCLALVNQTYFGAGWGRNWPEVLALTVRPANLATLADTITVRAGTAAASAAARLLASDVRRILREAQLDMLRPREPADALRDMYFFVLEYSHKVRAACARGDRHTARAAALQLQDDLAQALARIDPGLEARSFNRPAEYQSAYFLAGLPNLTIAARQGDLEQLDELAARLNRDVQVWMHTHNIALNVFDGPEALRRFLNGRV